MNLEQLYNTIVFAYDRSNSYSGHLPAEQTEVEIKVKVIGTAGPQPTVKVKHLTAGIDWDSGKIIIVPDVDLRICGKDEIEEVKEKYENLAMKNTEIQQLKKKNDSLKAQVEKLKTKLETLSKPHAKASNIQQK